MRLLITAWLWACDKSGKFTSRWNWDWLSCSLVSSGHIAGNGPLLLKHETLRNLWSEILSPNLTKNINRCFYKFLIRTTCGHSLRIPNLKLCFLWIVIYTFLSLVNFKMMFFSFTIASIVLLPNLDHVCPTFWLFYMTECM